MLYKIMPYTLFKKLWGDRKRYLKKKNTEDQEFKVWQNSVVDFYEKTQRDSLGTAVTNLSYNIVSAVDFNQKKILEIGPGQIGHIKYASSKPEQYYLADIRMSFLDSSEEILKNAGYKNVNKAITDGARLPYEDNFFDVVITFHQLEHVEDLQEFLMEIKRVLKPDGLLVGGVPTEGGFAWGLGRYFTTRRFIHKNYKINYDKIICWEHPNFVDHIQTLLHNSFQVLKEKYYPFRIHNNDLNLTYSFVFKNNK